MDTARIRIRADHARGAVLVVKSNQNDNSKTYPILSPICVIILVTTAIFAQTARKIAAIETEGLRGDHRDSHRHQCV